MEENQIKPEEYTLPFTVHSSYSFGMHVLLIIMIIVFVGVAFIPVNDLGGIIFRLLSLVLGLFLAYAWIYSGVMKKTCLELTQQEISFKTLFISKKLNWTDIIDVQTFSLNNNSFIGILSKETIKKRKDNFLTSLSESLGGGYTLTIPLKSFPKAQPEKLFSTIVLKVQETVQQEDSEEERINEMFSEVKEEKVINSNPVIILLKALIISLISGTIYGVLVYILKVNLIIIPVLGMMGILYLCSKLYQEKGFNIIIRFFIGSFCALQFFIGILVASLLLNLTYIESNGIWISISGCIANITEYPQEYMSYYLYAIASFFIGAFYGCSFKITRRIRKIFMHKQNGFYIKREKRYVSIYLIDYVQYNENEEKITIRINPNVCLIEKNKKNILAFYIPQQMLDDYNIGVNGFEKIFSNEKMYYKLNLGGCAAQHLYGYTCSLILNKDSQVELIQLETD
ncbi:hypothetical protein [Clostridium sp.]